jgi:hypothetical protein
MIKDDLFRLTAYKAPPKDDDEAIQRVAAFGGSCLTNLVCCVFLDLAQFRRALAEHRYNIKTSVVLENGRCVTHKATAIGPDGTEYAFVLNDVAGWHCEVVNARMTKPGISVNPDEFKAMKAAEE